MNLLRQFADVLVSLADRIVEPLMSPAAFLAEAQRLGWDVPPLDSAQAAALTALLGPPSSLTQLASLRNDLSSEPDPTRLLARFQEIEPAISALFSSVQSIDPAGLTLQRPLATKEFWADVGPALIEQGLIAELQARSTSLFAVAIATGFVERRAMPATPAGRAAHTRAVLNWGRLQAWLKDPEAALRSTAVGPNGELLYPQLFTILEQSGLAFGLSVTETLAAPDMLKTWYAAANPAAENLPTVSLPLLSSRGDLTDAYATVALHLLPVPAKGNTSGPPRRVFVWPTLDAGVNVALAPGWTLRLAGSASQGANHGVIVDLHAGADPAAEIVLDSSAAVDGTVELIASSDEPWVAGDPESVALILRGARASVKVKGTTNDPEFVFAAASEGGGVPGLALKIGLGQKDDFLPKLLGTQEIAFTTDLAVSYSTKSGWHIDSDEPLGFAFNLHLRLGPVQITHLAAAVAAANGGVVANMLVDIDGQLGPISFSAQRLGFRIGASPAFADGGQTKLAGLSPIVGIKPPSRVGLAIDASAVTGGGYLFFDPDKQQYAGMLQLELATTIAVKAIGILTTRMPDGSSGFSLLVIITAEGFTIQLGFGFTLTGIGGLLGVNRTMAIDALRGGIRTGTVGSIMFPVDPVRNAQRVITDVGAVFPVAAQRYVFGPMVMISWGTPAILTLEIGVVLEVPEPIRLVILGRLQMLLPDAKHPVVQIRMDSVGVIDFARGEVSLDATLYDSRLLGLVLTGDMAMRANFGEAPGFLLAVGGWNPRFPAPAGFPTLSRLALTLSSSENARLRLDSYLAVTSNTVQFGARADFFFGAGGFSVEGYLGFDALFHFTPFSFIADLGASVALRAGGMVLMAVTLTMTLSGPQPWHVWGTATFAILGVKQSVAFDARYGAESAPALPEPVNVEALLRASLADVHNWSGELPAGERPLVAFRSAPAGSVLRVHPLAELAVRERIAPLDLRLETFGAAPIVGATQFSLTAVRTGTSEPIASQPISDAFALAQFLVMSDDEKLSAPAFTSEHAGIRFTTGEFTYGAELDDAITYETTFIVPGVSAAQPLSPYTMAGTVLDDAVRFGAAGEAVTTRRGLRAAGRWA